MVQICFPNAAAAALWEEKQNVCTAAAAGARTAQKPSFILWPFALTRWIPLVSFRGRLPWQSEKHRGRGGELRRRGSLLYRSPWQVRTYLRWLALLPPLLPSHLSRCTFIFCWHADIRAIRQQAFPFCSLFFPSQVYHGWIVATVASCKSFIFLTILALHLFLNADSG